MRAILIAALLSLAGCQLDEPTLGGTVLSSVEAEQAEEREESAKYYEPALVPEVAWRVEVRLDDGRAVTVTTHGQRRYEPGARVRLLLDPEGGLLL